MRLQKWGGLLTYVSPYSVPAGGAIAQVNLTCSVSGQLTVRDGMQPVSFASSTPSGCLDVAGYSYGGANKVIALTSAGHLEVLESPSYGQPLDSAFVPDLPYEGSEVHVGYDYRYNERGDVLPDPPLVCFNGIYGGYAATAHWPACVQKTCASGITEWSGGTPSTTSFSCALHMGIELCSCITGAP
jgi:hypothetical protein